MPPSASDLRILYLTGGKRIGGMETHLIALAAGLPSSFRCEVGCLDSSADYRARLTQAGLEHFNLDCPTLIRPGSIRAFRQLEREVERFQPHIVHSYGYVADILAALLRVRGWGVRVITSRRGEDANTRHQAIRRLINRVSDKIICVSSATADFVHATESPAAALVEVIPNGVELDPIDQPSRDRRSDALVRFGTLGTVKPIKGTDLLVDAFMRFEPARQVELVIAGLVDRPWAETLRDRARLDSRIRFAGRTSEPRTFLGTLDAFVLPSRSEGMSNALLEAMASGLPCIATDVGSNRELLHPAGEPPAGVVCDVTADSLYRAMDAMARDAAARRDYGAQGAALVRRRYTVPAMVQQHEFLYRQVVRSTVTSPAPARAPYPTK